MEARERRARPRVCRGASLRSGAGNEVHRVLSAICGAVANAVAANAKAAQTEGERRSLDEAPEGPHPWPTGRRVRGAATRPAHSRLPGSPCRYSATEMLRRARESHSMYSNAPRTSHNFTRVTLENKCLYSS